MKQKRQDVDKFGDIVKIVGKADPRNQYGRHGSDLELDVRSCYSSPPPLLPNKAAPGQFPFKEILMTLSLIRQLPPQKYYLFGTPISHSPSPTLHNTGFKTLGLPHKYEILETKEVGGQIKAAITTPEFGGASVTDPFKLDVIPLLDTLSLEAKTIRVVNTIISIVKPDGSRTIHGDDADWRGIREVILSKLPTRVTQPDAGLIVAAGETSRAAIYAPESIGTKNIYLFDRTQALVDAFPDAKIELVENLGSWKGRHRQSSFQPYPPQ